jgi:hypothetical protein
MDVSWLHRYRLIGDENCDVGIECRDHFDGGRPLAFSSSDAKPPYADDLLVQNVSTIPGLLAAAEVHEHEEHGQSVPSVVNVHVQGEPSPAVLDRAKRAASEAAPHSWLSRR